VSEQRTPEEIRRDIESTREELADTAAALAAKADVKARAQDRVDEVKADVRQRVEHLKATVSEKAPSSRDEAASGMRSMAGTAQETVQRNPVPSAGIAAAVLGFALGYLIARRD
jgi:ElaB/YqjD/DUF883 family membrane-anchored ribosome-binding protein